MKMTQPPILSRSKRILLDLVIPLLAFVGMMEILRWLGVPW
jgi:hypothetical protein